MQIRALGEAESREMPQSIASEIFSDDTGQKDCERMVAGIDMFLNIPKWSRKRGSVRTLNFGGFSCIFRL